MEKIYIGAKVRIDSGPDKGQVGIVVGISGMGKDIVVSMEKKGFIIKETIIKHFTSSELTVLEETAEVTS